MTNSIIIKDGNFTKVQQALSQWISIYNESLNADFKIKIKESKDGIIRIETGPELDNERFYYLVNYLKYPEKINYNIDIHGYVKLEDSTMYPSEIIGKRAMIYIPENDKDYDYVYGVLQNGVTFKSDFGGNFKYIQDTIKYEEQPSDLDILRQSNFKLEKSHSKTTEKDKPHSGFIKRFIFVSILALIPIIILTTTPNNPVQFEEILIFSGYGLMLWIALETNSLKHIQAFILFIIPAIVIVVLGQHYINLYGNELIHLKVTRFSFFYLMLHRLIRHFYINTYDREPEFDKHASHKIDRILNGLLWVLSVFMSIFIDEIQL